MSQRFPRHEKLKSATLINRLFEEGSHLTVFPLRLQYLETPLPSEVLVQAGVTVSKRKFKNAVHRNRIKRLMRESYRKHKSLIFNNSEQTFAFLFIYLGKEIPSQVDMDRSMRLLIDKFLAKRDEKDND
ncbi:ribonuclease P protein component [Zeaxanthinibacter sp. PT1]|uniref:ribonuclease P protein component n=1 Tax=Zeaxanthinibacter TaxID=561554 RepID=UPI00234980A2|nr:ribonuclease P protein component [Zeaxanthinibacter sp. PT1]MDC6350662.1 ribonuclease P protein component [Zeaxanthinibacter sp. PT1]